MIHGSHKIPVVAMFYTYLAGTCLHFILLVLDVPLPRMIKILFPGLPGFFLCWLWFRWLFGLSVSPALWLGFFPLRLGSLLGSLFSFRCLYFDHSGLSKKSLKNNGLSRICPWRVVRIYIGSCMFLNGFDTALKEYIWRRSMQISCLLRPRLGSFFGSLGPTLPLY